MRKLLTLIASASLAACGGGSDGLGGPPQPAECSNDSQKQFVLDNLYFWYLWNDMLPPGIEIDDYPTPEILVRDVTQTYGPQKPAGGPLDRFSYVGSAAADQQFFGEGKYEGFGFTSRFEGADLRFTQVFVSSPAFAGGLRRGQTVLRMNGRTIADIEANEGVGAMLDNTTVEFEVQEIDLSTMTTSVTQDIVTIDPVPQYRSIDMGDGEPPVGYMEFSTFISTADPVFNTVFAEFIAAGVEDVIIDMRYNGGGLVATAELLADYLGGFANDNQIFTNTEFNPDRTSNNSIDYLSNRPNAIDINRLIVVASRGTASASELVINGLDPFVTGGVYIVGDNTFGKPVGQIGVQFCEKILRPTTFKKSNAAGNGDYFEGLPVDCPVADDLDIPVGAANDPNVVAALAFVEGAGCPVVNLPGGQQKAKTLFDSERPDLSGPAEREFAGAY